MENYFNQLPFYRRLFFTHIDTFDVEMYFFHFLLKSIREKTYVVIEVW